jgi:hypothetical protein
MIVGFGAPAWAADPPPSAVEPAPATEAPATEAPTAGVPVESWTGPTLCEPGENVLNSCVAKKRIVSLCASRAISETEGYIQYRIGKPGDLELQFPAQHEHPRGRFTYGLGIQGNSWIAFTNGGYEYQVFDELRSAEDGVLVSQDGQQVARVVCAFDGGFNLTGTDRLGMSETAFGN